MNSFLFIFLCVFSLNLWGQAAVPGEKVVSAKLPEFCLAQATSFPEVKVTEPLRLACNQVQVLDGCSSVQGSPIIHFDRTSQRENAKRILVIGLIHGDELPAGTMVQLWMERLQAIDPVSSWRILPVSNPDGYKMNSRMNSRGIDLNRNFQTSDWQELAQKYWKEKGHSNPRRFPGESAGSEPEVQCIQKHIESYQPDFVVAIHTPYAVLDFDGPKLSFPKFIQLPWQSLGNFPGSLGRYMWVDRKVPVLTIELKSQLPTKKDYLLELQDISSQVARLSTGAALRVVNTDQKIEKK